MKILVTGAEGQLGKSIQKISIKYPQHHFIFTDIADLDITNQKELIAYFKKSEPEFCINAAAYTNVDKAEIDVELNNSINITGPKNLAIASNQSKTKLIHISSDYVYNNANKQIMDENSPTFPKGEYAKSKLSGENEIIKHTDQYYIIRTSWLYSEYGNNFVKTMIKYGNERGSLNVVDDQFGSPTYASDLAESILKIINTNNNKYGIYNYSNIGDISWFDFAKEIMKLMNINCIINPIPSSQYQSIAPRPQNSRMSKKKIIESFNISIPNWKNSLIKCLINIKS